MPFSGRTAIVTGAASGIGQACAELLGRRNARVVLVDWNAEAGELAAAHIRSLGLEAHYCRADVSQAREVEQAVEETLARYGRLDVLINNAAVQILGTLTETTQEQWERMQSVNLEGVFLCSRYAIPAMLRTGGGSIVNMSSALGLVGDPDLAAYGAFKGGIIALTKAMAIGYGPHGIRVNCICPGDVNTPMVQEFFAKAPDPERFRAEVASHYALRRIAEPAEIAEAAAFLASGAASFITGTALVVDGGLTSRCY